MTEDLEGCPEEPPVRAELYLRMTELEDQIRELQPSMRRSRGWGVALSGTGVVVLAMSAVQGTPEVIMGAVLFIVISLAPWLFYSFGAREVSWLRARIREIEKTLEVTKVDSLPGKE